jgi:hypothetical protein
MLKYGIGVKKGRFVATEWNTETKKTIELAPYRMTYAEATRDVERSGGTIPSGPLSHLRK